MWHRTDHSVKNHYIVCCAESSAGGTFSGIEEAVHYASACGKPITALYECGINLPHYGEIDQLAPAGAMHTFKTYVQDQSVAEAEEFFADLQKMASDSGVQVTIQVVYGRAAMQKQIAELSRRGKVCKMTA